MSHLRDFDTLFSLAGKTALVTGSSRGLGLHTATALLRAGCSLVAWQGICRNSGHGLLPKC